PALPGYDAGTSVAVDGSGSAYVSGETISPDFPTTPGAYDTTCGSDGNCNGGQGDVFVTKFDPTGSSLAYSTFLGGADQDGTNGGRIAVDGTGAVYVTGDAGSGFPTTPAAFDAVGTGTLGAQDVFVSKLDPSGSALVYSMYLAGSSFDIGLDIAIDGNGSAYATGCTASLEFTTTTGQ